ncbi:MAG: type II toxin-antitoxin system YoeB family toxin [Chitinophagales bacterium]|nr:type II toxin-antitoxin system YoeB family toxin [Chitinophagales bacterium]
MRIVVLHPEAVNDLAYWAVNDLKMLKRIVELLEDIQKTPFGGKGKT